jgi:hypothetical protein
MYPLQADVSFFQRLRSLDYDLFLSVKASPCTRCGGKLDTSHYPRKPRGAGEEESRRFSLCCRTEGCRRRVTPPSLRFLGRKVYSSWVVILVLDFSKALGLRTSMGRRTLSRWRQFWRERLNEGHPFMRWARGELSPGTPGADRPGPLLFAFGFPDPRSWIPLLRFFTHSTFV